MRQLIAFNLYQKSKKFIKEIRKKESGLRYINQYGRITPKGREEVLGEIVEGGRYLVVYPEYKNWNAEERASENLAVRESFSKLVELAREFDPRSV